MGKYIVMNTFTNSEWQDADYGILEFDKKYIQDLIELSEFVKENKSKIAFAGNFGHFVGFYKGDLKLDIDLQEETNIFKEIDISELDEIEEVRPTYVKIYEDCVTFVSNNKYSDEEYWCEVSIDFLKTLV